MTEGRGTPLAVVVSGANRHDMTQLAGLLDAASAGPNPTDPPRLVLDRGRDHAICRAAAAAGGFTPRIPPTAGAAAPLPPPGHPDRHPPRRRAAGRSGSRMVGPIASAGSRRGGRNAPVAAWGSSGWPPSRSSAASSAMPAYFLDRAYYRDTNPDANRDPNGD
ncbi:MAG: hypothetical protein ACR2OO_16445 [Thermomicrobiales bacterium]